MSPVFFDAPPVAEVALSIQTTPIPRIQTANMSVFWDRFLRADYPHVQDQPAAPPAVERFDGDAMMPNVVFGFGVPMGRLWFLSDDGTRLVQLQNDRLIVNWRRLGSETYPHYAVLRHVINELAQEWDRYLRTEGFEPQPVVQAEVTYINQIPIEEPLANISDLGGLLTAIRPEWPPNMGHPELLQMEQRFLVEAPGGKPARMYVTLTPALLPTGQSALTLNLVVRGAPQDISLDGVTTWLDFAHNQIINSFADITTEAMRHKWRQRHGTCDDA